MLQSKITAAGRTTVPAEIRAKLRLTPGSVLEWEEKDGQMVVRRAGKYTSADMREVLFSGKPPAPKTLEELKDGIRQYILKRHGKGPKR